MNLTVHGPIMTRAGQTTGQGSNGFGAPWWVVTPAGKALQN